MGRLLLVLAATCTLAVTQPATAQVRDDLTVGMMLEPPSLDPTAEAAAAVDEVLYANVFEGLVRFAPDGSIIPALAKSWDISDDGLTYTFHLNDGVTFHDGSMLTAEDVKFSLERINAEGSLNAQKALYSDIATVAVVDPLTVKVTLKKPNGSFIYNLGWGDAVIVAPETAETNNAKPVGTGPFVFASRVEGDNIVLTRNPSYWGAPVKLESATFRFIGDPNAAFSALQAGDVDVFPNYPAPETLAQFSADPRFRVVVGAMPSETVLAMNNAKPPLDILEVRQAIAHAIDRRAIIDGSMFGYGAPIGSFYPPGDANYVDLTAQSAFAPEKSKALLEKAGWSEATVLSLKVPPVEAYKRAAEIIAQELAAVGIKTETTNVEWAQWLSEVFTDRNYDLSIVSHSEPNDIGVFARDDYYFNYRGEPFRETMAELDVTADPARRTELLRAAQQQLADDYAAGFLFIYPKLMVEDAKLRGMWADEPAQSTDLTGVYWTE